MSAKIHLGRESLARTFRQHVDASNYCAQRWPGSSMLLLVYGIECGLKAVLLKQRRLHSTSRLDEDDFTHDLDELQIKLGRPRTVGTTIAAEPHDQQISPNLLHAVFRYGGKFASAELSELKRRLNAIVEWIDDQL